MKDLDKSIEFLKDNKDVYSGWKNTVIRYYFYAKKGLEIVNEFRYLVMAVMGVCFLLKISSWVVMATMFLVAMPVLMVLGYLALHHMDKVIEFLNLRHATLWSKYSYEMQEKNVRNIEKIKDMVEKVVKNVDC